MAANSCFTRTWFTPMMRLVCTSRGERGMNGLQENNGLVLGPETEASIGSLSEVFSSLMGTSIFAAIGAPTGVRVGVERDEGMRRELSGGQMCVEAACQMSSQLSI